MLNALSLIVELGEDWEWGDVVYNRSVQKVLGFSMIELMDWKKVSFKASGKARICLTLIIRIF
tara:strand:- start:338 stop:526 length:189 start_codon:yes stop_codon:yes gene_type:complete